MRCKTRRRRQRSTIDGSTCSSTSRCVVMAALYRDPCAIPSLRLSSTSCRRRVFRRNRGIALTRFVPNVVSVPIAPPVSACSPVRADDHGDPWRKMSVAGAGLYARRAQRDLRPPRSADTGSPPACVLKKGEGSDHLKGALHCCHRIRTLAMKRELLRCMGRLVRAF